MISEAQWRRKKAIRIVLAVLSVIQSAYVAIWFFLETFGIKRAAWVALDALYHILITGFGLIFLSPYSMVFAVRSSSQGFEGRRLIGALLAASGAVGPIRTVYAVHRFR
jgi:hypothetical protein